MMDGSRNRIKNIRPFLICNSCKSSLKRPTNSQNIRYNISYSTIRHSEQKETISENQSAAFASFKKRKQEQDEETAAKPVKKKKWYEEEEPEEVKIPEIIVKSPGELRKQAFEDNERQKVWKKTGKKNFDLKSLSKKKVVVKNGAVIDAPDHVEETQPKEIWNDDFVESQGEFFPSVRVIYYHGPENLIF